MRSLRLVINVLILSILACSLPGFGRQIATPTLAPLPPATLEPISPVVPDPDTGPPFSLPDDVIYIGAPGSLSSVTSPVTVTGIANPTFEQNLVIRITDENGDTLAIQPTTIQADIGQRGPFEAQIDFSVTADQPGRISVFDIDARDGSLVHLSSVEVTLLASGEANIQPPIVTDEIIEITTPEFQADVTGGTLLLEGFSEYFFEANLSVGLCADGTDSDVTHPVCGTSDNVFAEGFATINSPDIGQPGPFQGEIQFNVEGPKIVRVIVYAVSARDGGLLHASSTLVTLLP